MRGRVHVDLDGALSDFNAMCADKTPTTRDLTEPERFVMDEALKDAGVDLQGSACEPIPEPRWSATYAVGLAVLSCLAFWGLITAHLGWLPLIAFTFAAAVVALTHRTDR